MRRFMMCLAATAALFTAAPAAVALAAPEVGVEAKAEDAKEEKAEAKTEEPAPESKEAKAEAAGDKPEEAKDTEQAPSVEELVETGEGIVEAARSHEWALMIAGCIMLLVGVVRRFALVAKLPARYIPWASMVIGVLAVLADNLSTGGAITVTRIVQGMLAGMAASGAWGMIGRHLPMVGKAPKPTST
jgi:uncharacterized membrane protein YdbT with pleckstrin-like domain